MKWNVVPAQFHFLRPAVDACGETRVNHFNPELGRHESFLEKASPKQLATLTQAMADFEHREVGPEIQVWLANAEAGRPSEKDAAWRIRGVLMLFDILRDRESVEPDSSAVEVSTYGERGILANLEDELLYLVLPAMLVRADTEMSARAFIDHCSSMDLAILESAGNRVYANNHYPSVMDFLDRYPIEKYEEAAWLYFLFAALDYAEISF